MSNPPDANFVAEEIASNPLLCYLLDSVPDPFMIVNGQREIVFVNETLITFVNQDQPVLGRRLGELISCANVAPGERCGTSNACTHCDVLAATQDGLMGRKSTKTTRVILRSGEVLDVKVTVNPLRMYGEAFAIVVIQDRSAQAREHALQRVFLHDLLNIAGTLVSYSQLVKTEPDELPFVVDQLYDISTRLVDEIQTQKDIIAAEANELKANLMAVSPHDMISKVINSYKLVADTKGVTLTVASDYIDMGFETDPVLLGRVIGNMVKNAIEASMTGDEIRVGFTQEGQFIRFWVQNPAYIPRRVQEKLFERSFSTKGKGRGLGTYSMKLLTEEYLGGQVHMMSTEDDGTTFSAIIPLTGKIESD